MEFIEQWMAVAGVLALLAATLWWLRRRGWVASTVPKRRELECLERLPLGPQHSLHLVRAGGRLMLVSSSPGGCALISDLASGELRAGSGGAR